MKNKTQKIVQGSIFIFIGTLIAQIFAYLTRLVMVNNMTPLEYGLFSAIFTFIFLFLFFRDLGLNTSLTKYIAQFRVKRENEFIKAAILSTIIFQFLISIIFFIIFWFLAEPLAKYYFKEENAIWMLRIFALYIPIGVVLKIIPSYFRGFQKFFILSTFEPIKNISMFLLTVLFFTLNYSLFSPILAYVLLPVILAVIYYFPIIRTFNFTKTKGKEYRKTFNNIFLFGVPLIGVRFFGKFISYFDTIMLTMFVTLDKVGIYNIVLPTSLLLMIIPTSISSIIMPIIVEKHIKKKYNQIKEMIHIIYKYLGILMFPAILILIVYAEVFISLFFGREYILGVIAFQILLIGILFNSITAINLQYFIGTHNPKKNLNLTIFGVTINIVLNIILIPILGILGAAIATASSYIIMMIVSLYYIKKLIKIKIPFKQWSLSLISIGIPFIIIEKINIILSTNKYLDITIHIFLLAIIYLGLLFMFRLIDIKEIKKIIKN